MIKVFQIDVDGVGTDSFYETETAEEAIKDYAEDYKRDFGGEPDMTDVEAILYDEYYED